MSPRRCWWHGGCCACLALAAGAIAAVGIGAVFVAEGATGFGWGNHSLAGVAEAVTAVAGVAMSVAGVATVAAE